MTTRRAMAGDVDALTRLRVDFLQEARPMNDDTRADVAGACRRYFSDHVGVNDFEAWLAESGGEIVAAGMVVYIKRPPRAGSLMGVDAFLYGMYTVPGWRRRGVGTALLNAIVEAVKQTDAHCLMLYALDDGHRIYERAGFTARADNMELTW